MKRSRYLFLMVLSVLVITGCGKTEEKKEEKLRPVRYQVAGVGNSEEIRTFTGVAKALGEIDLSFRVGGIITQINHYSGAKVKVGQLIAKLDNVDAQLALEKSISALNSARSDLNTAKNELERIKTLYEKNSVSLSDYQSAKNAHQSAVSQFESAQRNKRIQETQVGYGFIYAPKDGEIISTNGDVDENVKAGHVFAVLNAGEGMRVETGIPENIINKITEIRNSSVSIWNTCPTWSTKTHSSNKDRLSSIFIHNQWTP